MKNILRAIAGVLMAACVMVVGVGFANHAASGLNGDPMLRVSYTWNGNVDSGDWDNGDNWEGLDNGYPDDSGDDATLQGFGYIGPEIDLNSSWTIDDLTLDASGAYGIVVDGEGSERTLDCDTLVIGGPSGQNGARVVNGGAVETR